MTVTTLLMNLWPCQSSKMNQNYLKPSKCGGPCPVKRSSTCTISLRETVSVLRKFGIKQPPKGCIITDVQRKKITKLAISWDMEVTGWVSTKDSSSLACVQLCRLEKTIFQKSLLSSNNFLLHIVCRNGYKYIIRVFQMQKQKWKLKRKSQEAVVTDSGTLIWWRFWFPPSSIFFPFSQIVGWQNATY